MIPTHGTEHERLLQQFTCGDLDRGDRRLQEALDDCPECRDRLAGLESVADLLTEASADRNATLAALDTERDAPGSDLVAPFLEQQVAERRRELEAAQRRMPWLPLAAAAAVVATAGTWLANEFASTRPAAPAFLGEQFGFSGDLRNLGPDGRIGWEADLPVGGVYEVEWLDALGTAVVPNAEPRRQTQAEWKPTPEELQALPEEFQLRVTVTDTYNQVVAEDSVWVHRSR